MSNAEEVYFQLKELIRYQERSLAENEILILSIGTFIVESVGYFGTDLIVFTGSQCETTIKSQLAIHFSQTQLYLQVKSINQTYQEKKKNKIGFLGSIPEVQ